MCKMIVEVGVAGMRCAHVLACIYVCGVKQKHLLFRVLT